MRSSRLFLVLSTLALAFFILGCSGKPVDQIDQVEKARAAATAESAADFAANDWQEAETDWAAAQKLLEQEKWAQATTALLKAKSHYTKARDISKGLREAAIKEINGTTGTAKIRCEALKKDLEANAKKIPAAKKKIFEDARKTAEEKLARVATQMEKSQYQDAKLLAGQTLREIWDAQKELETTIGGKKGK